MHPRLTRLRAAAAVMLFAGLALLSLREAPPAPPGRDRPTELLAPAASAAGLALQPRPGLDAPALVEALARLGVTARATGGAQDPVQARVPTGEDARSLARRIASSGLAASVEEDGLVTASATPAAPRYESGQRAVFEALRLPAVWSPDGGAGITVAVVDSGVDWDHPALAARIAINLADADFDGRDGDASGCADDIAGCSFVSPDTADPSCGPLFEAPNWRARDDEGHGTFVAGLIAAGGPRAEIAGVAPGARILPVKVLDCTGTGRIAEASAGVRYAARMGAHVINLSFGTRTDSAVLRSAIEEAQRLGSLIVASAGNDGRRGVTYPAVYPGVLSVAASGDTSAGSVDYTRVAPFADFGAGVALLAPGVGLLSTLPPARCGQDNWVCEDGPYARGDGSSFATPIVAAAAALFWSRHLDLPAPFVGRVIASAHRPAPPGEAALLDIALALQARLFEAGLPGTSRAGGASGSGAAPSTGN
ncbi:MAG: hypothetical protein EPO16_09190 [Dehalococcoidia bacterium]|nr:MAG: hypothetical protein EPO16_09190 [Dehalococcoidia bacterium]